MPHMRLFLAILIGKIIIKLTRFLKLGGGSAAPGLYALKIDPRLVEKLVKKIPQNIVITGTNGKTTTARMLAHLAKEAGLKVIRNHTGSNLERGIASVLITHYQLPTTNYQLGIWELDEAAFNTVVLKIKPDIIIFLNVSRDQLDRYGEVDKVVNDWCNTLSKIDPKTTILINADEPDFKKLKNYFPNIKAFGKKDLKNTKLNGLKGSEFRIQNSEFRINLPGIYNIYNALAAITCAKLLNLPVKNLTNFQPAFGRFEKLPFGYIFLIKNPTGATEVFKTIAPHIRPQDRLLLALNDNIADGTDVSWIWDADFEKLRTTNSEQRTICSGKRAYDLAVRLKYAGFDTKYIRVEPSLKKALREAREGLKGQLFILPTYTALLELQKILKSHYWEES
ncbi:hypothetical protein A3B42_04460 [Candidatus Daviesbacteria bacterium RIFCSPLOWO2_01_FULL_38_10]|uniref:Lipid II isoglutaminyl synthase (glutamine-hydrolyzing) subunit MurT n=1 Tax=Candidatus Daviesbacteria bacterium GW2011_GWF2_38_6 TaxID=1618432 RepID=A0A0G0KLS5_9BACT|nr:MAG: hypothetical protein US99_C0071G0004 [Candidatus Daviesbacteria bacterium GW2011_GWF2_38_6]OGE39013.1 MAG: hypothetical protein A3B42_04460 [Candidatus Daviesbacteria bacterium RIFCSPLOWO2_01_FULL_38_10]HBQ51185.1 hypothetical protein [Candidatus Daviesbacteria bacterium]HCB23146.1 hypothetical protein [Candidatus Daviesbacteria bacterium]